LVLGLSLSLTTLSWAQDDAAPQPVDSPTKAYSIVPPKGWDAVSGELSAKELDKLPEGVREHYDKNTTDIMFMDLNTEGGKDAFKDNLNVVVLDEEVPIADDLKKELEKILVGQYTSLFTEFKLESFEGKDFGALKGILIQGTYKLLDYDLFLYQALISGPGNALVVTCTMEKSRKDDRIKICDEAFSSITFKKKDETP